MNKASTNNKGIILFIVLATLLIMVLLANLILGLVSSQARLTHHQVSRIQAYYAARAGATLAIDMLRRGDATWIPAVGGPSVIKRLCRTGCDVNDLDLPGSISEVEITISPVGVGNCTAPTPGGVPYCIYSTADYALPST
ncbi:MAG: hypothetical protein AB1481_00040 [Candidatus Omnitrophota bacterium]